MLADYGRLLELARYREVLDPGQDLILKLNLSWTKYFPACSSQPWQLEGVLGKLLADGFAPARLLAVENKTVVQPDALFRTYHSLVPGRYTTRSVLPSASKSAD